MPAHGFLRGMAAPAPRLIAVDMDGTLLNQQRIISRADSAALVRAQDTGIAVCVCTGRCAADASAFLMKAGITCAVLALNGTYQLDAPLGRVLRDIKISRETTEQLMKLLDTADLEFTVFSQDVAACNRDEGALNFWITNNEKMCLLRGERGVARALANGANKIAVICHQNQSLLSHLREAAMRIPGLDVTSSGPDNLEFIPYGEDKGRALALYAQSLAIPLQSVMAIGDSPNDLPMLHCAGWPVAMGNAGTEVKAAARFHTSDHNHHGVARIIKQLVLNT